MGILEQACEKFIELCRRKGVDRASPVTVRRLSADEAIGERADESFVLKQGKETIVEAAFAGARGQAFTDRPGSFSGTLGDVLDLPLAEAGNRAFFVATLNAVLRHLGLVTGTVHCRNEDPRRCGPEMAGQLEKRFHPRRVGLVGLQPAILAALAEHFGADAVCVVDLNPDSIGQRCSGVEVWDGATRQVELIAWADVVLATGSTVVNGSIDALRERAAAAGRPLVFFGNTISGVAFLADLPHICPLAQ